MLENTTRFAIAILLMLGLSPGAQPARAGGAVDSEGTRRFPYGLGAPPVLECAPTAACVLIFEPSEVIYNRITGDTANWVFASGVMGESRNTACLYFQPVRAGLSTNLLITTSRRIYQVKLRSVADVALAHTQYGFSYPKERSMNQGRGETLGRPINPPSGHATPAGIGFDPARIDAGYRIVGNAAFAPLNAWSDGVHTYLKMPEREHYPEPSIYDGDDGGHGLINWRPDVDDRSIYVIDGVPTTLKLVVVSGRRAQTVTVEHERVGQGRNGVAVEPTPSAAERDQR